VLLADAPVWQKHPSSSYKDNNSQTDFKQKETLFGDKSLKANKTKLVLLFLIRTTRLDV
jgi:hypothetical protein